MSVNLKPAEFKYQVENGNHLIQFFGDWLLNGNLPNTSSLFSELSAQKPKYITLKTTSLGAWDSGFISFLFKLQKLAQTHEIELDCSDLPEGASGLLKLALKVEEREGARRTVKKIGLLERTGNATVAIFTKIQANISFIGEIIVSFGRFIRGRGVFLRSDFWVAIQETGVEALPIVSLISFLAGVILAFIGIVQLNQFGAGIYVADLVAIGIVREMGALMTAIIMAGRTGAAFAAQIGTMKVNEELDALTTMGINPIDFLVLPRLIALIVMMPLLSLYSNLLGIMGGAAVSLSVLDISAYQYFIQTIEAISLSDVLGGLAKATLYGILIAIAGCRCGIQCGSNAAAVGQATTSAVVAGIIAIVVSNAVMNVIYTVLGI